MREPIKKLLVASTLAATVLVGTHKASADPCPLVMIILDRSGSMDESLGAGGTKWQIATTAIGQLLAAYGAQLPFGMLTFQDDVSCTSFASEIHLACANNNAAAINSALAATAPSGSTNTGEGVDEGVKMLTAGLAASNPQRPGAYIILITDGQPNCNAGDQSGKATFTTARIANANSMNIKTFVVGFGNLDSTSASNMNTMAAAGGEPCTTCGTNKYYAADSAASLNDAITTITGQITGEFGGTCDDSCYTNGCSSFGAGFVCVKSMCKSDPCATVRSTCAPGDYCYTDGNSPGICVHPCTKICGAGEVCTLQDSCAKASAVQCSPTCQSGQVCINGVCADDPCNYVTQPDGTHGCPSGQTCQSGTGVCLGNGAGGGGGRGGGRNAGCSCDLTETRTNQGVAGLLLLGLCGLMIFRLRRRSEY